MDVVRPGTLRPARRTRFIPLFVALIGLFAVAGVRTISAADVWGAVLTLSPTTSMSANRLCYTDGRDIACNDTAPYLTSGGLLGIATTTPSYPLDVSGSVRISGDGLYNTAGYQILQTNGNDWLRINPNASFTFGVAAYDNWAFGTGGIAIGGWTDAGAGNLTATGGISATSVAWGVDMTRTETRDDAGLHGNAGAVSGFFQTAAPVNYPAGASSWWHLLDVRHSHPSNNYALQIAGSFFDQNLYFRKTDGSASTSWHRVIAENSSGNTGVGTSSPDSSAALDVSSTSLGFLPPRMTSTERDAVVSPTAGLMIFNTDNNQPEFYNGTEWYTFGTGVSVNLCPAGSAPGTTCPDGTVLAGTSPDGDVPMYTTACDVGQTLSGTCTGTRSTITWNNGTSNWTTTGFTSPVTGAANTAGLYALSDASSPHNAAKTCAESSAHGYDDWYLPSRDELAVLYSNRSAIGGFLTDGSYYWASMELNYYRAWLQRFSDGYQPQSNKNTGYLIRCVRK